MIKKISVIVLISCFSFSVFAEPFMYMNKERYEVPKDLFEDDLDFMKYEIDKESSRMVYSGLGLIGGFILSSAFVTLTNAKVISSDIGNIGTYSSYGLIGISAVGFTLSTRKWKGNTEDYFDTIRLKSQYYNLVK